MIPVVAKMGGSIKEIELKDIRPKLLEFIDMLDGYGIALILAGEEEKEVQQQYVEQDVMGLKVQTVIGKNYRINLFEDDKVEFNFSVKKLTYDKVMEFQSRLNEMRFEHRTTYKSEWGGLGLKSVVVMDADKDTEIIMQVLMMFKIE